MDWLVEFLALLIGDGHETLAVGSRLLPEEADADLVIIIVPLTDGLVVWLDALLVALHHVAAAAHLVRETVVDDLEHIFGVFWVQFAVLDIQGGYLHLDAISFNILLHLGLVA